MRAYVVAGSRLCGTSAMMKAHILGGIDSFHRQVRYPELSYPNQTYEVVGGPLKFDEVNGRVVKQFGSNLVDNMPDGLDLYVVYMIRGQVARAVAHPDENLSDPGYWEKHTRNIMRILNDGRVKSLVVMDYDRLVEYPILSMIELESHGWKFNYLEAAEAIDNNMRHAKRGPSSY